MKRKIRVHKFQERKRRYNRTKALLEEEDTR